MNQKEEKAEVVRVALEKAEASPDTATTGKQMKSLITIADEERKMTKEKHSSKTSSKSSGSNSWTHVELSPRKAETIINDELKETREELEASKERETAMLSRLATLERMMGTCASEPPAELTAIVGDLPVIHENR